MAMALTQEDFVGDLEITMEAPFAVYPAEPTPRRSMFLSNIDQTLVSTVATITFFPACKQMSFDEIVQRYVDALGKLLVHYDFVAGRLTLNEEDDRLEIDCNGAGVFFGVGTTDLTLEELKDLKFPNPAFRQLILQDYVSHSHLQDLPLLTLQATRFKCGGFTVGAGLNHCLFDGISSFDFTVNLASIIRGESLKVTPDLDRTILKARVPQRIDYEHLEYTKFCDIPRGIITAFRGRGGDVEPIESEPIKIPPRPKLVLKLFPVSVEMLNRLKEKAMEDGKIMKCTSFEVVTAHLWRARSQALEMQSNETSTVLFPVECRSRLEPPISREYAGNAVVPGYARATVKELRDEPFSVLVQKVQQGLSRLGNDYVRSMIDWLEVHKGIPCAVNSFSVVAWWRLGLEDAEYPWGNPLHLSPAISHCAELVMLLHNPSQQGGGGGGFNVAIALQPHQFPRFHQLFQLPK
uniref:Omega-hydroxypalmitate O-feruloyl transferase n=1 Tax=Picea sitchensis TaxID=3332 RepID=A9NVW5_PICSI|nr:unknown [Picea sitchensis]